MLFYQRIQMKIKWKNGRYLRQYRSNSDVVIRDPNYKQYVISMTLVVTDDNSYLFNNFSNDIPVIDDLYFDNFEYVTIRELNLY